MMERTYVVGELDDDQYSEAGVFDQSCPVVQFLNESLDEPGEVSRTSRRSETRIEDGEIPEKDDDDDEPIAIESPPPGSYGLDLIAEAHRIVERAGARCQNLLDRLDGLQEVLNERKERDEELDRRLAAVDKEKAELEADIEEGERENQKLEKELRKELDPLKEKLEGLELKDKRNKQVLKEWQARTLDSKNKLDKAFAYKERVESGLKELGISLGKSDGLKFDGIKFKKINPNDPEEEFMVFFSSFCTTKWSFQVSGVEPVFPDSDEFIRKINENGDIRELILGLQNHWKNLQDNNCTFGASDCDSPDPGPSVFDDTNMI